MEPTLSSRLYVGNLPFAVTEESLRGLFKQVGKEATDVVVVRNKDTGKSRGFGFVTLGSVGDAEAAVARLQGLPLEGRPLVIAPAKAPAERPAGETRAGGSR